MKRVDGDHPGFARPSHGKALVEEIAKEEAHLAELERDRARIRERLDGLKVQVGSDEAAPKIRVRLPVLPRTPTPETPADKVKLFRQLFRGRADVFPTRFVSKKTGKQGYAPACANKFVRGVCELPKIKCGDCRNQAFIDRGGPGSSAVVR